jgi:hypothetical protein
MDYARKKYAHMPAVTPLAGVCLARWIENTSPRSGASPTAVKQTCLLTWRSVLRGVLGDDPGDTE